MIRLTIWWSVGKLSTANSSGTATLPRLGNPRQVVAHQIDDHQIFGALLGVRRQLCLLGGVGGGIGAARRGALHRLGLDSAVADREELLGRQREDRPLVVDDHSAPPRPRRAPQPRVQRQRIARHRHIAAKGQIGLVIIPREQMLAHLLHRRLIDRALDPRARGGGEGAVGRGQQRGKIRGLEPVVEPERQQRPVTASKAVGQRGIERMTRLIGQPPRGMRPARHRRADALERRHDLLDPPRDDDRARRAIQSRRRAAGARIVEQDPHRRRIALPPSRS